MSITRTTKFRAGVALISLFFTLTCWAQAAPPIAQAEPGVCYATTGGGNPAGALLTVDANTGQAQMVGISGLPRLPGMAIDSTGRIFATDQNSLYQIDAVTGAATLVGVIGGVGVVAIEGLAFDRNDTLWAVDAFQSLFTLNTSTGESTLVGNHNVFNIIGLAFDGQGSLFGSTGGNASNPGDIYQFDQSNGSVSLVGNTGRGRAITDLHYISGQMFGVLGGGGNSGNEFNLVTVSTITGGSSLVGPMGFSSVSSLAGNCTFEAPPIPTLNIYGILALVLMLGLGTALYTRYQRRINF